MIVVRGQVGQGVCILQPIAGHGGMCYAEGCDLQDRESRSTLAKKFTNAILDLGGIQVQETWAESKNLSPI
jgi:hypothetical protein